MLAWLASASAALMLMVAADAALQIGMGAAKGLGMGPLLHLLRECRDSGQQISVLKVQMAVDLARDASACCRELPEVLEPPRWWKNTDDWPPHVVDLLTSFTAIAKQTMSLCKMGDRNDVWLPSLSLLTTFRELLVRQHFWPLKG